MTAVVMTRVHAHVSPPSTRKYITISSLVCLRKEARSSWAPMHASEHFSPLHTRKHAHPRCARAPTYACVGACVCAFCALHMKRDNEQQPHKDVPQKQGNGCQTCSKQRKEEEGSALAWKRNDTCASASSRRYATPFPPWHDQQSHRHTQAHTKAKGCKRKREAQAKKSSCTENPHWPTGIHVHPPCHHGVPRPHNFAWMDCCTLHRRTRTHAHATP